MKDPIFLTPLDIIIMNTCVMEASGGVSKISDDEGIGVCAGTPQVRYDGKYVYDLFGMATNYISCIGSRHLFVEGNKATALAAALAFLYFNGYEIKESYEGELADIAGKLLGNKISMTDVAEHLKANSVQI